MEQGIPQDRLAKWVQRAEEGTALYKLDQFHFHRSAELENGRFRMYMHWRLTWGRRAIDKEIGQKFEPKVMTETQPGVALSIVDGTAHLKDRSWYKVYSTKEEAAKAADLRKEAAKYLPTPLVTILQEKRSRED
jgi:hypothetical protein